MRVLTLNPGSSSLKLALVAAGSVEASETGSGENRSGTAVRDAVRRWGTPDAVAIRFVHGGDRTGPVLLDAAELERLEALVPLAPLHQPASLRLAAAVRTHLPQLPVVAVFDTAFHATLPEEAARYPLPREWTRRYRLRRYGFHGLSCGYALRRCASLLGRDPQQIRMVCCHLGAGVSITAIRDGASVDTSMGFTPLEGAAMATRSGSIDPGLLLHLLTAGVTDVDELAQVLYHRSGLAGMSGTSGDVRTVLAASKDGDADADLALGVYVHRLCREIGAMAASLDRLDAMVFTGGVAEHQPYLVGQVAERLGVLGIRADPVRLGGSGDRMVHAESASVPVLVLTAREDLELAYHTEHLLAQRTETAR